MRLEALERTQGGKYDVARGGWIGITARHTRADLIRSLIEGVSYSQKDCLDIIEQLGVAVKSVRLSGGGETTGYSFFAKASNPALVFRKRALHAGSAIGPHKQDGDEVYYVLSGSGELTLDGEKHAIGPGTAILTRPGSSHSLKQNGTEDLVIIITYPPEPKR